MVAAIVSLNACESPTSPPTIDVDPRYAQIKTAPEATCYSYPQAKNDWGDSALREKPSTIEGAAVAIVFVHGWQPEIETCQEFVAKQLPGEIYFQQLAATIGSIRPTYRLYAFSYPTFNRLDSGSTNLAALLNEEIRANRIARVVFVGHSMGGLISRKAASQLQSIHGQPRPE